MEERVKFFEASKAEKILRVIMVLMGIVFLALGIAVFKLALLGNDPYTGMLFAISDRTGFPYPWLQVMMGLVFFVFQLIWGRHLVGFGTVYNAFCIGFIVDFFYQRIYEIFGELTFLPVQLLTLAIGMLICSFGISIYQEADMGVSPYDATSLMLAERQDRFPYFWCRIFTDTVCAVVCFVFGGIVGVGTVVTALGFGPFVTFFDRIFSDPVLRMVRKA